MVMPAMVCPSRCSSAATTELSTPPDIATAIRSLMLLLPNQITLPAKSAASAQRSLRQLRSTHPPAPPYFPAPAKNARKSALPQESAPSQAEHATAQQRHL